MILKFSELIFHTQIFFFNFPIFLRKQNTREKKEKKKKNFVLILTSESTKKKEFHVRSLKVGEDFYAASFSISIKCVLNSSGKWIKGKKEILVKSYMR